ncbi:hypothetical protein GMDG_02866 [Pseudogymnoascus destructans 20631-21]|uniref:Pre-mRNA-splicing factor PRP46 n=1 Tax=Pseudogymnoascus destructans (strain ATCC MYA-4855 / 20631-21) TaxID=658429 RepID=L8G5S4_PSED2|nr:hypothetical protein GMDG_02866 [Pseudogymnoascus destructans 20631-21]
MAAATDGDSAYLRQLLLQNSKKTRALFAGGVVPDAPVIQTSIPERKRKVDATSTQLVRAKRADQKRAAAAPGAPRTPGTQLSSVLSTDNTRRIQVAQQAKPEWHAPWKLMRVISGHLGWVRSLAVEPNNQWFASGAGGQDDQDLGSGDGRTEAHADGAYFHSQGSGCFAETPVSVLVW